MAILNIESRSSLANGRVGGLREGESGDLIGHLHDRTAHVAVLGLGYAGLPMAIELARAGFAVTGLDIDEARVRLINEGQSPITDVSDSDIVELLGRAYFRASTQVSHLNEVDCVLICVPTPLSGERQPDLSFVTAAARSIADCLHPDMLVILQSTCSPGTTRQVVLPILETSGLRVGEDFFLAFAPERIDPGNTQFTVRNTPKVIGGITNRCTALAEGLFEPIVERVVAVTSPEVAEMSKLLENTFRFINISFVNEMALLCDRIGVSIWEVVQAASTKPFAFMPHYPGPGVGGHCIPVVPFYLDAVAREHGMVAGMIDAAGRINDEMPHFVVAKLERLLADRGRHLFQARVLLVGVSYKADVSDIRESPAVRVLEILVARGANVAYYDPHVATVLCTETVSHSLSSQELAEEHFDCAVLLTAHSGVDHVQIARQADVILDTRNFLAALEGVEIVRL